MNDRPDRFAAHPKSSTRGQDRRRSMDRRLNERIIEALSECSNNGASGLGQLLFWITKHAKIQSAASCLFAQVDQERQVLKTLSWPRIPPDVLCVSPKLGPQGQPSISIFGSASRGRVGDERYKLIMVQALTCSAYICQRIF